MLAIDASASPAFTPSSDSGDLARLDEYCCSFRQSLGTSAFKNGSSVIAQCQSLVVYAGYRKTMEVIEVTYQ